MSMTELERAREELACAYAMWNEEYERAGIPVPRWVANRVAYWQSRVTELDAAEEEAEKPPEPTEPLAGEPPYGLLARVRAVETAMTHMGHRAGDLEYDMDRLFGYVSEHTHTTNHPPGLGDPCTVRTSGPWTQAPVVRYEKIAPVGSKPEETNDERLSSSCDSTAD